MTALHNFWLHCRTGVSTFKKWGTNHGEERGARGEGRPVGRSLGRGYAPSRQIFQLKMASVGAFRELILL